MITQKQALLAPEADLPYAAFCPESLVPAYILLEV